MSLTLREHCEKRLDGLKRVRQPYEAEWKEIAQHCQPSRSRFLADDVNRGFRRSNRAIYSGHGILSFRTTTAGMTSGLSSPSRPWFKLSLFDDAALDDQEVREWLSDVQKRMERFLAETNFYAVAKAGYAEISLFGTEAAVLEDNDDARMVGHSLTVGEYWAAVGANARPNTLYRRVPLTVAEQVDSFGYSNVAQRVRDAYDRSDYEQATKVMHAMEPNPDRDPNVMTAKGKEWLSFYWDEEDGDKTNGQLRRGGSNEQPFWVARWDTVGGDTYGSSPGMEALPDLRELQLQTKKASQIMNQMANPEKVVPSTLKLTGQPGNVVSVASVDKDQVFVPYVPPPEALNAIEQRRDRCEQAIDDLSFASLFNAISAREGVQPLNNEETNARIEEKMTQLGPAIERVNGEKLQVAIDRTFGIMSRRMMLPTAPESIQGQPVRIDFVSILTQMQRMVGLGQTERVTSFIGNLAAAFPEAADKLNVDEAIDDYADRAGSPPKIIRSDDEVEKLRQARQQQQANAQAMAAMPAVKDGADAARLLSEAAQNGGGVQNLVGGPGL